MDIVRLIIETAVTTVIATLIQGLIRWIVRRLKSIFSDTEESDSGSSSMSATLLPTHPVLT